MLIGTVTLFVSSYISSLGALYSVHVSPQKNHPDIEIRYDGFVDNYYAWIDKGVFKEKILSLLTNSDDKKIPDCPNRKGQGSVKSVKSGRNPIYGVLWTDDGYRIAVSCLGWFVAAYDVVSGDTIRYRGYRFNVQKTDKEIEQFLNK